MSSQKFNGLGCFGGQDVCGGEALGLRRLEPVEDASLDLHQVGRLLNGARAALGPRPLDENVLDAPIGHLEPNAEGRSGLRLSAQLDHARIGGTGHGDDPAPVAPDLGQNGVHESSRHVHSLGEGAVAERLGENANAVAETGVVGDVPALPAEHQPRRALRVLGKVAVVERLQPGPPQFAAHLGQQLVPAVGEDAWVGVGVQGRGIRDRIAVAGSVGRVQVHDHVGVPPVVDVGEHGPHLGRLRLHAVAVEVEPLPIGALADGVGTVLAASVAVLRSESVVAVAVVDRGRDQHDLLKDAALGLARHIAQHHQHDFLAFNLACVDVGLNVDDGLAGAARLFGCVNRRDAGDHERDVLAARALADGLHQVRCPQLLQLVEEGQHVGVVGGLSVLGALGPGQRPRIALNQSETKGEKGKTVHGALLPDSGAVTAVGGRPSRFRSPPLCVTLRFGPRTPPRSNRQRPGPKSRRGRGA